MSATSNAQTRPEPAPFPINPDPIRRQFDVINHGYVSARDFDDRHRHRIGFDRGRNLIRVS